MTLKTVLGDVLVGDHPKNIKGYREGDDLLWRCKNHKIYEAKLLLEMPKNSSFLDIGAHFGDTVLTMAIHARNNNRSDIKFFAFEPFIKKCEYIRHISKLNGLNITVFNNCVGNTKGKAIINKPHISHAGHSSYRINNSGDVDIIRIDDIKDLISPIGIMHIDTEGWEGLVLKGSHDVLSDTKNKMYIIVENARWLDVYFNDEKKMLKYSEDRLMEIIENYNYIRLDDIYDEENNLVFKMNSV